MCSWRSTNAKLPLRGVTPAHAPRQDRTISIYDAYSFAAAGKPTPPSVQSWVSQSDALPILSQKMSDGDSDPLPDTGNFDNISSYKISALSTVAATTEVYPTHMSCRNASVSDPPSTLR